MARRRSGADGVNPRNHCAFNVALYGPRAGRWSMTERGVASLDTRADGIAIGTSAMRWDASGLTIDFDEITVPVPRRIRGRIRLTPGAQASEAFVLNPDGHHVWQPLAPRAHVEVECESPALRWRGDGYFDHNRGAAPLEEGFRDWIWSRAPHGEGAAILYDGVQRNGETFALGLQFDRDGLSTPLDLPPVGTLGSTGWRLPRRVRSDASAPARLMRSLEDAPFYARSVVSQRIAGIDTIGVHETLSLDRFRSPVVQAMLPFRMPRRSA